MSKSEVRRWASDLVRLSVVHVWFAMEEPALNLAWRVEWTLRTLVLLELAAVRVGFRTVAVEVHLASACVRQRSVEGKCSQDVRVLR